MTMRSTSCPVARSGDYPSPLITDLLNAWGRGDREAFDTLVELVYGELHWLASYVRRGEAPGHSLETTGLLNEAYLRLVKQEGGSWESRAQFYALAAQVMHHVLVDHARQRLSDKRGGGKTEIAFAHLAPIDQAALAGAVAGDEEYDILALNDALESLAKLDAQQAQVVELRFFLGLTIEDTAKVLGVSPSTVKRAWSVARAWLGRELGGLQSDRDEESS